MKIKKTLSALYSFPGFRAMTNLKGICGDPDSRIITLKRSQKKRFVHAAQPILDPTTIQKSSVFEISHPAALGFFLSLNNGVLAANDVTR
jgi:hypothetical protein